MTGLAATATKLAADGDSRAVRFRVIAADLTSALATDVIGAAALYSAYLADVTEPDPQGVQRGQVGTQVKTTVEATAPGWIPLLLAATQPRTERGQPSEVKQLSRLVSSSRWVVNAAILVIAVATGVKVLWLDNLSWGGQNAWLLAFLWGAGVQITGDAFAGMVGLRAKLSGLAAIQ